MTTRLHRENRRLTPVRIVALVAGCLPLLPGVGLVLGGVGLGGVYAFDRDGQEYVQTDLEALRSPAVAVTAEDLTLMTTLSSPGWLVNAMRTDLRLRVTPLESGAALFVGIGPAGEVGAHLDGLGHDELVGIDNGRPVLRGHAGFSGVVPATLRWEDQASGTGTQELTWQVPQDGPRTVVLMNADGAPGVAADVAIGICAGFVRCWHLSCSASASSASLADSS